MVARNNNDYANKYSEGDSFLKQIRYFLVIVDKSHNDRKNNIVLKGYIYGHEESETNSECFLKAYLKEIEKSKRELIGDRSTGIKIAY
jgi:hypothetical protein